MLAVSEYSVELVKDPFRILAGKRYEFVIQLELDEEDELYSAEGIEIKAVYKVDGDEAGVVSYGLYEKSTGRYIDAELEDEEEEALAAFCREHYAESEN
ncbi:pullulanase [Cohnella terricola]|uniref:Pullulanase n=2 Tax=Cohnella terricola TaxID=1289167 RepID=A0A559JJC3_9BACL|nr:pullulanase [Cohnella terricola]